jgi:hypothetical protein
LKHQEEKVEKEKVFVGSEHKHLMEKLRQERKERK